MGERYCVSLVDLSADCERSGRICTGSPIVTLATQHDQPTLGSRSTGRLAPLQMGMIINPHSENTTSGEHCGQGEKAG